jgi:hypothetical protein
MTQMIEFGGKLQPKWVVIQLLKSRGWNWKQIRTSAGIVLARESAGELAIVRIRDWASKTWDGPHDTSNLRAAAQTLAEDELVEWQQ